MINKFDETRTMDYENGFYLTTQPSRIGNIISHYELYKMVINLPGDIVECGVFRGGSLIQWATFRELLENQESRKIIGFDMFGPFPEAHNEGDELFRKKWLNETGGDYLEIEELEKSLALKGFGNVELVKGDILETLEKYIKQHPFLRISLLHIDTDIYEPSKKALEILYDRVVQGGIIVADDYGVAGETDAIDEFFDGKPVLKKLRISHKKPSYIIKE
ncbi:Macrocin-O-methyltransferase (TylF) [Lachnospiraceae bacterium XBB2008]|nr:Macrocin-O-methyltransferase (TylF) [Lachnospiraceae bacterium XBB2008]